MKSIRTGLTTANLLSLLHHCVYVRGQKPLSIAGYQLADKQLLTVPADNAIFSFYSNQPVRLEAKDNAISLTANNELLKQVSANSNTVSVLVIKPENNLGKIIISADKQFTHERIYSGELMIIAQDNTLRLVLNCPLEDYVKSVLKAEMPAKYDLEAIKAQAVSARTYAFHPRVNHKQDLCDVCDSYLCCQAFSGWQTTDNSVYEQASAETAGQILTYRNEPILSLFSSSAGGHTENFEDCFSDWKTDMFPPQPLPYLRGISESTQIGLANQTLDEKGLKNLWHSKDVLTFDAWSKQFRWSFHLSAEVLESTMHHILSDLISKKEFASFIVPPPSRVFGNIQKFSIDKRGIGGTAIILKVHTSKGIWQVTKQLPIRNLFKNKTANLERLPSAKIFFDQIRNDKQQLQSLTIYGLGHGHGVGLQQVGAQGMAQLKNNYRQILSHYYTDVQIENA